jgi:chromosome segregation protein
MRARPMEARPDKAGRFSRESGKPRLAEAPRPEALEVEVTEILNRLEEQAAENGRLEARAQSLERAAGAERDARRRLAETLKRERKAAAALHERAERDREAHAAAVEELERVREGASLAELHVQQAWSRLAEAERRLAHYERGFFRRLFRRPAARG